MKKGFVIVLLSALLPVLSASGKDLKILYWNIQNGMWSDQGHNYDNFVEFVSSQKPDICVWCEAESRYRTDTCDKMQGCEEAYLPWNWDLLARRYGHDYVLVCGKRDTFPQVITSKFPIRIVKRIDGNGDNIVVVHGSGWAQVDLGRGKQLNIVTVHTWPFKYGYMAENQTSSAAAQEGDIFRAKEMEYICSQTVCSVPDASSQLWMMLGDFNSKSHVDNYVYGMAEDDKGFLVHDWIRENTPYIDIVDALHPSDFQKTTFSGKRIDFIYVTEALRRKVRSAYPVRDGFASSSRDPRDLHGFCNPSDHYPIVMTVKL